MPTPWQTTPGAILRPQPPLSAWVELLRTLLPALLLAGICLLGSPISYLLFHTLAEVLSIVVAFTAMAVATTSLRFTHNHFVVYIAIAIGWCAGLDLLHTLVFKGMQLLPTTSANPATQLWLAARFIQAVALVTAPYLLRHHVQVIWLHLGFGSATVLTVVLIFSERFPVAYIDGYGLTAFKVYGEYCIIALLSLALWRIWQQRTLMSTRLLYSMLAAVLCMIASEFAFTRYISVYAQANLIGHLLKIFAYWFVYVALVHNTLREPFSMLARAASTYDAVPDPTLITTANGQICQANRAAALYTQCSVEQLVGQSSHTLFHDARLRPEQCPVCSRLAAGDDSFTVEIERANPAGSTVECGLTPFIDQYGTYVQVIRDISERRRAAENTQRLTHLYEMLSATNRSVVHSHTEEDLLNSVFNALLTHGTFPMLFIALTDNGQLPLHIVRSHGIPDQRLTELATVLGDAGSPFGELYHDLLHGIVDTHPRLLVEASSAWGTFLQQHAVKQRAILPLRCNGQIRGIIGVYAPERTEFSLEQLRLLDEMSLDISFALHNFKSRQQRMEAEQQAQRLEHRFQGVFEASPLPMQVYSLHTRKLQAINQAHRLWLGYMPEDIASEELWFKRVYPDSEQRHTLLQHWHAAIAHAQTGEIASSPELTLHCKDGSSRIARGTMTIVGDDIIVAWTDLTEIRHNEFKLRESEQRFRGMIEQAVIGVYVRRQGRFIYVNPQYCQLIGWSAGELLDQEELNFAIPDEHNIRAIHTAWDVLHTTLQTQGISYHATMRCKDGRIIELGLQASVITWDDGQPATIVMAQDITESKRAEDKISNYVKQLESSMKATLQAISHMVDLRDPYTSGHQRRVSLIAKAIAQRLGWSAKRCETIEMAGLVHDVGKIAVPLEILIKPTHLTVMEMNLVKVHVQASYDILQDVPFDTPIAEIVYQHHERLDGSGYPRGLQGAAIMPEARVLAVADVLESMAAHRPYRAAVGLEAALAELEQERGRLYDAQVVDTVLQMIHQQHYQLPH